MGRSGFAAKITACALTIGLMLLGTAVSAAGDALVRAVQVRVEGINRSGHLVNSPYAALVAVNGATYSYFGSPIRLPPGSYLVGAEIPDHVVSGEVVSSTLVVRNVRVEAAGVIRLNGRNGRLLAVSLTGARATQDSLIAGACLRGQIAASAGASGSSGQVHVVAYRGTGVRFSYFDELQAGDGTSYLLAGSNRKGIPARLTYHQDLARLARVTLTVRDGVYPVGSVFPTVATGGVSSLCSSGRSWQQDGPFTATEYRTPGRWTTSIEIDGPSLRSEGAMYLTRTYLSGRGYSDVFGSAVTAQRHDFPASDGKQISYFPGSFEDPIANGGAGCCSTSVVTLRLGHRLIKRQRLSSLSQDGFLAALRQRGWYVLNDSATRWLKGAATPPGMLSSRQSVTLRFHAGPESVHGWRNFPLTEAVFLPRGLSLDNAAPSSGTTRIVIRIDRAGAADLAAARYKLRVVRAWYSVNDGHTWRLLSLARTRNSYAATVRDPAGGFVALRAFIADVHGDQTTQTIYRAYAVR